VDDGTAFEVIRAPLDGYAFVAYSTHSSTPQKPRSRVVLPLAQPVLASAWPAVWTKLTNHFGGEHVDAACKNLDRFYYLPTKSPGGEAWSERGDGAWLDPDTIPELAKPEVESRRETHEARALPEGRISGDMLVDRALGGACRAPAGRHNHGLWLACQLRDNGFTLVEAEPLMRDYQARSPGVNTKGELEPYTTEETLHTLRSVYERRARAPWVPGGRRRMIRIAGLPPLVRPRGIPLPPGGRPRGVPLSVLEERR
jgi:hypothetical protein